MDIEANRVEPTNCVPRDTSRKETHKNIGFAVSGRKKNSSHK